MGKLFRKYIKILFSLSLLALLTACGNEAAKRLELADSIMEENPDSALTIIESIDTASLTRERDLRLRDLLMAQAKFKKYQETSIDKVSLSKSREYFTRYPKKDYLLRSNYYIGYLAYLDSSFNDAISLAADVFIDAKNHDNSLWLARSAELISFIFNKCDLNRERIVYDSIAASEYRKSGKDLNALFTEVAMAIRLSSAGQYNEAETQFNELSSRLHEHHANDTNIMRYYLLPAFRNKVRLKNYEGADSIIKDIEKYGIEKEDAANFFNFRARQELGRKNFNLALQFMDSAKVNIINSYDSDTQKITLKIYSDSTDNIKLASEVKDGIIEIQQSILDSQKDNPVVDILNQKIKQNDDQKIESQNETVTRIALVAILLVIIISFIIFYLKRIHNSRSKILKQYRKKTKEYLMIIKQIEGSALSDKSGLENIKMETDLLWERIRKQKQEIINSKSERNHLKKLLKDSLKKDLALLNVICEIIYEIKKNDIVPASYLEKLITNHFNDTNIELLVECLSSIDNLYQELPKDIILNCSKSLRRLMLLSFYGFSVPSISLLTSESESNIYTQRTRLLEYINKQDFEQKEKLINKLAITKKTIKLARK